MEKRLNSILDLLIKLTTLSTIVAIIFGGWIIFSYSVAIGHRELFAQIISSNQIFISISTLFAFHVILLNFLLITPYLLTFKIKQKQVFKEAKLPCNPITIKNPYLFLFTIPKIFLIFWVFLTANKTNLSFVDALIFIAIIFPPILVFIQSKKTSSFIDQKKLNFDLGVDVFASTMVANFISFYWILSIANSWIENSNQQIGGFLILMFITIINDLLASIPFYKKIPISTTLLFSCAITISILVIAARFSNNFSQKLLLPLGLVESPKHSQWYYINREYLSHTSLDESAVSNLKQRFSCPLKIEHDKPCENNQREDLLYGYMAWNIGDTKLLCPSSTNIVDKNSMCLRIDKQNIQPLNITKY